MYKRKIEKLRIFKGGKIAEMAIFGMGYSEYM
jgi:hypothetical protein